MYFSLRLIRTMEYDSPSKYITKKKNNQKARFYQKTANRNTSVVRYSSAPFQHRFWLCVIILACLFGCLYWIQPSNYELHWLVFVCINVQCLILYIILYIWRKKNPNFTTKASTNDSVVNLSGKLQRADESIFLFLPPSLVVLSIDRSCPLAFEGKKLKIVGGRGMGEKGCLMPWMVPRYVN